MNSHQTDLVLRPVSALTTNSTDVGTAERRDIPEQCASRVSHNHNAHNSTSIWRSMGKLPDTYEGAYEKHVKNKTKRVTSLMPSPDEPDDKEKLLQQLRGELIQMPPGESPFAHPAAYSVLADDDPLACNSCTPTDDDEPLCKHQCQHDCKDCPGALLSAAMTNK